MIEVKSFSKFYGRFTAVNSISFTVQTGVVTGLLGPNGAGKTTIMKAITGCHFPSDGSIVVENISVEENPVEVKKLTGYMPENPAFYPGFKVREYLDFIAAARLLPRSSRLQAAEKAAELCSLTEVLKKPIASLSKGFRQRLAFAQAIIHDPPVIILDEPTVGLDPAQIQEIRKLIIKLGKTKTVLLSTHIMQEVEAVCSAILIINNGIMAASGTSSQITTSTGTQSLEEAFLALTGTAKL